MILFINSFLEKDIFRLKALCLVLVIFYTCVLIAVLIDLASGIQNAHQRGEARTSYGFRRTVVKVRDYYSVLLLCSAADVVASIVVPIPFFTALAAIGLIFIEAKSFYENRHHKNKGIRELPKYILEIWKNKDEIDKLVEMLKKHSEIEKKDSQE